MTIGFEDHRLVHIGQRLRVPALALLLDALLSCDELLKDTHGRERTHTHTKLIRTKTTVRHISETQQAKGGDNCEFLTKMTLCWSRW